MGHAHDNTGTRSVLISLLVLLPMLLVALAVGSVTAPQPAGADFAINAIYLAGPESSALDLARTRSAGVRVVSTGAALQSQLGTAEAIVIDRGTLDQVPGDWLVSQFRRGKLIVTLGVPIAALGQRVGFQAAGGQSLEGFLQDYGGRPFYSMLYGTTDRSGATHRGASSDIIFSTDAFLAHLRLATDGIRAELNPPATPPGPRPVRPTT